MPFPRARKDVPRAEVHAIVEAMLWNEEVGNVVCEEQPDGAYTVRPRSRD